MGKALYDIAPPLLLLGQALLSLSSCSGFTDSFSVYDTIKRLRETAQVVHFDQSLTYFISSEKEKWFDIYVDVSAELGRHLKNKVSGCYCQAFRG